MRNMPYLEQLDEVLDSDVEVGNRGKVPLLIRRRSEAPGEIAQAFV